MEDGLSSPIPAAPACTLARDDGLRLVPTGVSACSTGTTPPASATCAQSRSAATVGRPGEGPVRGEPGPRGSPSTRVQAIFAPAPTASASAGSCCASSARTSTVVPASSCVPPSRTIFETSSRTSSRTSGAETVTPRGSRSSTTSPLGCSTRATSNAQPSARQATVGPLPVRQAIARTTGLLAPLRDQLVHDAFPTGEHPLHPRLRPRPRSLRRRELDPDAVRLPDDTKPLPYPERPAQFDHATVLLEGNVVSRPETRYSWSSRMKEKMAFTAPSCRGTRYRSC